MQERIEQFDLYWAHFSSTLQLKATQSQNLYRLLSAAYSEKQRAYHTQQHIVECLHIFHQIKHLLDDPIAVELALWFHDAVYDPKACDNEEQSAKMMLKQCVGILNTATLEKVARWIIATKQHQATHEADLNALLDIDLSILGTLASRFVEYEQQIQQEYAWADTKIYQQKRRAVLQHFAQMQPLYQTDYFQQQYEQQAKINLHKALNLIKP